MQEVLQFLKANAPFYVSTVDDGKPRVRPFGFVMEFEGKLWFSTNNKKEVFRQLQANPCIEICAASPDGEWLRLRGKAVLNAADAGRVKEKALEVSPKLAGMYKADDPIFEVFYLAEGEAVFYSMTKGKVKTVKF